MDNTDNTEHDAALAPAFAALKAELGRHDAPRGVEKELMQAFARRHAPRRWYHRFTRAQWGLAGGLGSAVAATLVVVLGASHAPPQVGGSEAPPLVSLRDNGAPFIALDSAESIEGAANAQVVEAEVPRSALAAAGVPVTPETADQPVRAEMLVSADGRPLAIRLSAE
ncbi:MAG: hypothetical protein ACXU8N_04975 [Telluria sp.]